MTCVILFLMYCHSIHQCQYCRGICCCLSHWSCNWTNYCHLEEKKTKVYQLLVNKQLLRGKVKNYYNDNNIVIIIRVTIIY